jgi:2,4-dienoyl-CoA reductase-like NADH-dependent reductase (Old Yellow Enzyme family)
MGALTRNRCVNDFKPGPAQVKHYSERARDGTGLIVNEGTLIDWTGTDWKYTPVMINDDHAGAWKKVVAAVHEEGGTIFFQAWHVGT